MPYHLFICRHAQAEDPVFKQADYDRQLTSLGIQEAQQAANWLRRVAIKPSLIVCSSAQRTKSTASIIASKLAYNQTKIVADNNLYNASEAKILNFIAKITKEHNCVILVGHNPGVSDVVSSLSGTFRGNVPTGSVHHLSFEFADWQEILLVTAKSYEAYTGAAH